MGVENMSEVTAASERRFINILPADPGQSVQSLVSWGRSLPVDTVALFFISLTGEIFRLKSQILCRLKTVKLA